MQKVKPNLHGDSETLLIALWLKAKFLKDDTVIKSVIDAIDYDFSKFEKKGKMALRTGTKTDIFDREVRSFITRFPNTTVVNIGAGLDTRFFRVDNGLLSWYEVDFRDATDLRKQFFKENERYQFIASSACDPQWVSEVKKTDRHVLFIAEAVLMYFEEKDVKKFLSLVSDNFPNSDIIFEVIGPFLTKFRDSLLELTSGKTKLRWGISNVYEMERWDPRLNILEVIQNSDSFLSALTSKFFGYKIVHAKVREKTKKI